MNSFAPNLRAYFSDLVPPRHEVLLRLEEEAAREKIPIIGPAVAQLLKILVISMQAKKVLELGTATGYSTIFLAQGVQQTRGYLTTIEHSEDMAIRAAKNIHDAGLSECVSIRQGDAQTLLKGMNEQFDMIFMDIDKNGYHTVFPECSRLLRKNGLLFTDNVSFPDSRTFNTMMHETVDWMTIPLLAFLPGHSPEYDGISLSVKL